MTVTRHVAIPKSFSLFIMILMYSFFEHLLRDTTIQFYASFGDSIPPSTVVLPIDAPLMSICLVQASFALTAVTHDGSGE